MDSQNEQQQEIQRREQELKEREQAIRLRELELEINQGEEAEFHQTRKHNSSSNSLRTWGSKLVKVGKFIGIVIVSSAVIMMALRLSIWLTHVAIIAVVAFFAYKFVIKDDG